MGELVNKEGKEKNEIYLKKDSSMSQKCSFNDNKSECSLGSSILWEPDIKIKELKLELKACKKRMKYLEELNISKEMEQLREKLKRAREVEELLRPFISDESPLMRSLDSALEGRNHTLSDEQRLKLKEFKADLEKLLLEEVTEIWREGCESEEEGGQNSYQEERRAFLNWREEYLESVSESNENVEKMASSLEKFGGWLRKSIAKERGPALSEPFFHFEHLDRAKCSLDKEETLWDNVALLPGLLESTLKAVELRLAEKNGDKIGDTDHGNSKNGELSLLEFVSISGTMSTKAKTLVVLEVVNALKNLHKEKKSYTYLSPANILLSEDAITLRPLEDSIKREPIPPFKFFAPEMSSPPRRGCFLQETIASDSFSLGKVILWLSCVGVEGFPERMNIFAQDIPLIRGLTLLHPRNRTLIENLLPSEDLGVLLAQIFEILPQKSIEKDEKSNVLEVEDGVIERESGFGRSSTLRDPLLRKDIKKMIEEDEETLKNEMEDSLEDEYDLTARSIPSLSS